MVLFLQTVLYQSILLKVRTEKDFRKENGKLVKDDVKAAKEIWKKAKQELGKEQVTLELLTSDNVFAKKNAEYLKR